ncbi:hypothetical protein PR001_g32186 [Phytophthora rubi]|uniref:Uncharacterized protein n=1 Tax=Phytophthora rubi TaxID=129364 RepID=A0A6A3GA76_9STRA|nr:hypothetical protein PR001_g32186 [Phytophthora rubi]KAE8955315.1 hypothetical protein PR002_g31816 [Phytophthora rubi]
MQTILEEFAAQLPKEGRLDAAAAATDWDLLKIRIWKETLLVIKQRRKSARASFKQKLKRLLRQEKRLNEMAAGCPLTVDTVTDLMDALTLAEAAGDTPLQRVRGR